MTNATHNHCLTFRTADEMAKLRPFGVICMIDLSDAQKQWAADHGIEIATDYEGLRFSKGGASVTARPRTDGDVNIALHHPSVWEAGCWQGRTTYYRDGETLCDALRALISGAE